jgi:hypothetical protein
MVIGSEDHQDNRTLTPRIELRIKQDLIELGRELGINYYDGLVPE